MQVSIRNPLLAGQADATSELSHVEGDPVDAICGSGVAARRFELVQESDLARCRLGGDPVSRFAI